MRAVIAIAVLAVLAIGLLAGLWLYCRAVERDIADIQSRLVSEAALAEPNQPDTASIIKLAPIQCERVFDLRSNRIAYALKGEDLDGRSGRRLHRRLCRQRSLLDQALINLLGGLRSYVPDRSTSLLRATKLYNHRHD